MTGFKDDDDVPSSPEPHSTAYLGTHSTEDLPAPQADSTTWKGHGSSHAKITFEQADRNPSTWDAYPRHRSPPPNYNEEASGWTGTAGIIGDDFEAWNTTSMEQMEEEQNEKFWWNASNRRALKPLGPGMLPVLAVSQIHDDTHELLKVSVTYPELHHSAQDETPSHPPPTPDEVRRASLHQNSYYCAKCNSWVIIQKTKAHKPPIYPSYKDHCPDLHFPLSRSTRKEDECNSIMPSTYSKAHHYHLYEDSIPSTSIQPPFQREPWESLAPPPRRLFTQDVPEGSNFWSTSTTVMLEMDSKSSSPDILPGVDYLDLYACCQCSTNFYVTRRPIPGVVSARLIADLTRERYSSARSHIPVTLALEFIVRIVEKTLWQKSRPIKYESEAFRVNFGTDAQALQIWEQLGFIIDREQKLLVPPSLEEIEARSRLLRGWMELSAYTADYLRHHANTVATRLKDNIMIHKLWVKVNSASDELADNWGSHPNQIPRGMIEAPHPPNDVIFHQLGMTQSSYSPWLLHFAYKQQIKCDITHLPQHFGALVKLVDEVLPSLKRDENLVTDDLRELVALERSKGRWTTSEYDAALDVLQLGEDSPLMLSIFEIDAIFLEQAYKSQLNETWRPSIPGVDNWNNDVRMQLEPEERRQQLKEALRIAAEGTGKESFYNVWKKVKEPWASMDPEKAYTALQVPNDTSEEMLLMVYHLRVEDSPGSMERMKEALEVLAAHLNSARLKEFLRSGTDPGEAGTVIQPDWPRGLNQLGNTCYLNSLLQYFYTIKDLRDVILSLKSEEDLRIAVKDALSDAQLQKHRVGGRLVTRKEIERSRRFVLHLSDLFTQMAQAEANAITPPLELAKLALVTSKDEEEDEAKSNPKEGTGTLPAPSSTSATTSSTSNPQSSTVLGKRHRESDIVSHERQIGNDSASSSLSKPRSPRQEDLPPPDKSMRIEGPAAAETEAMDTTDLATSQNQEIEMDDPEVSSVVGSAGASRGGSPTPSRAQTVADSGPSAPPPLPKRDPPPLPPRKQPASDSVMMFGKQHDVSECMDNCMFQIETALLDFQSHETAETEMSSVVKRLFYGKMRQRITPSKDPSQPHEKTSVNEKEDIFSHLPVNVSDEGFDLHDGLGGYFYDNVEFEGKKAVMEVTLVDLPPILQVQLQRVQFNRETLQPYKSQAFVKFGESLFVDRYLEDADPEKKAKSKAIQTRLTQCRDRINAITQDHGVSVIAALQKTSVYLNSEPVSLLMEMEDISSDVSIYVETEAMYLERELAALRQEVANLKLELEDVWKGEQLVEYELTSVFIHRGSTPSWGHYFFYARNLPDNPDQWFKYNDSNVSIAQKDDIFADTTGSTANPYLLVYARKGSGVVHTVNRQP
ncbi:ubiquitin-specific protease ubp2 [Serendipita sp. 407]|nr:ubiquitin-specific protease ubp2 [Serendipita sp. 407]